MHDDQKLAPVVTTVLSFGNSWNGPRSLHELLDFPEEYRELLDLLGEVTGDKRYREIAGYITEKRGEDITMCTVAEELEQRGIKLGIEQGIQRVTELVKKMILAGEGDLVAELDDNKELFRQMCEKYLS